MKQQKFGVQTGAKIWNTYNFYWLKISITHFDPQNLFILLKFKIEQNIGLQKTSINTGIINI